MKNGKNLDHALSGKKNKKLDSRTPTNNERTAAWTQVANKTEVPQSTFVEEAKDWVDNESRL